MGGDIPKQYVSVCGKTVIEHTINNFIDREEIESICVSISESDKYWTTLPISKNKKIIMTVGGSERYQSVYNGLSAIKDEVNNDDWVLVHDAVRPCIKKEDVERLINELQNHPIGGILAVEVVDTLKKVGNEDVVRTIERKKLYQAQTPQMFRIKLLKKALEKVVEDNGYVTDEAEAIERLGHSIKIVSNSKSNIKITHNDDLKLANYYLNKQ